MRRDAGESLRAPGAVGQDLVVRAVERRLQLVVLAQQGGTPGDQLLRLTGNVKVTNSSGTIDATELVVNLETNVSTFTSSGGGSVTGIFSSQ